MTRDVINQRLSTGLLASGQKIQVRDRVRGEDRYHIYVLLYRFIIQRLLVDIACDMMVLILPPFQHWWNVKGKYRHRYQKMLTERMDS